jgi:hypothetical protein
VHCCHSHLHCADKEAGSNGVRVLSTTGAAHPPHTQDSPLSDSRYTRRCPSVVLWTPCSGGECVCSNRPSRVGKRHDAQAACEPGAGG